ncbi:iron complex outermembrane receptor protein [Elizabethkingia sp. YR214]|uniref:TonB-dependent receptor n=1 Tax=Elizabethkingia sp. YR214 TaxID=2135667 RepID=UPI000D2F510F|nr:TonB-dependent receptor [Elizabethkingia sp. YR214]PUB34534.1 iron complex outermembrane receptor protein [Elizabethkingia sp. YR214]
MKKTLLCLGSVFLVSGIANAQKNVIKVNDSVKQGRLDEVIITATRTPEIIKKTASTVHIINRKEIEEQAAISPDLSNILAYQVPGLAFGNNLVGNRGQTLRGRNVLIMIDGIPQSSPLRNNDREIRSIDPSVLERIEVVKGATSIYGNGAEGGIINYITQKDNSKKTISGKTVLGFTGHELFNNKMFKSEGGAGYRVSQSFYGKLGKFDYLVNGTFTENGVKIDGEGLVQNPRYGLGETKVNNAFAKLGYSFNDKSRIELMYNYYSSLQDSKYILDKGKYGVTPSTGKIGEGLGVKEGTKYNHNAYLKYTNASIFRNTSFNASVYFQDFYTIYDYREAPRWKTGGQSAILEKKYGFRTDFNTEFRKDGILKASLTYGIDLLNEHTTQPLVDGRVWVPELNMLAFAPFIQSKLYLTEDLTVKMGSRWDLMNIKVPDYTTLPSGKDSAFNVQGGSLKYKNFSYNAGLSYTAFSYFQPFTSYSRGFNIYDLGRVLRDAKSNVLNEINTEPVEVDSYEIGFNSKIGKIIDFSASYFYNYSKLGADLVSVNGFWTPLRAPQYISGVDLVMNIYPTRGLNIGVNYTYQEGKVDVNNDNTYQKYLSGLRIAPPRLNSYVKWMSDDKKLNIGVYHMYSFKRDRFSPDKSGKYEEGEGPVESFNLFNFQGSYKFNQFIMLGLGVENLFNKTYFTPTSMYTARDAEYVRGNGRYYTLTLSFRY